MDHEHHCCCGHCTDGPTNNAGEFSALPPRDVARPDMLHPREIDESTTDLTGDGRLIRRMTRTNPSGDEVPASAKVSVHYTGRLADTKEVFDSSVERGQPFEFDLGVGQVIKGWDLGIIGLREGEACTLTIASDLAYGAMGSPPKIPGGATLEFDIELLSFTEIDHDYPMLVCERITAADVRRVAGNELFAAGKNQRAIGKFLKGIELLDNTESGSDDEKRDAQLLRSVLLGNLTAALMRTGDYVEARRRAQESLDLATSVKGYRRLAQICLKLGRPEDAVNTLVRGLAQYPGDEALKGDLVKARGAEAKVKAQMQNMYSAMFSAL